MPDESAKDIPQRGSGLAPCQSGRPGLCYQCGRRSAGCPVAEAMDSSPTRTGVSGESGIVEDLAAAGPRASGSVRVAKPVPAVVPLGSMWRG